jgi:hypothetical protein
MKSFTFLLQLILAWRNRLSKYAPFDKSRGRR